MDVYLRVSRLGERDEEEATESYEAQAREWADRHGVAVGEVAEDTDVSGSVAVADRKLERLVQRVESGDSDGIITPYLDRFGRDLIEGSLALKRIVEAGGRLVAVRDGFDSGSPGSELLFNIRMSIAQDFLRRQRDNWRASRKRAADRGVYLAARPPFGYARDEERRLVKDPDVAPLVRELFKRRASGANYEHLRGWLCSELKKLPPLADASGQGDARKRSITKQGVRTILRNRAYVGEQAVQDAAGRQRTKRRSHPAIVSQEEWSAAQIRPDYVPRNGTASGAEFRGLVFCETCGGRMKTGLSGPKDRRLPSYVCVNRDCDARASIRTEKLDGYAEFLLIQAAAEHEPHVEAVILGDTRYQDALSEVQEAQRVLDEFRDDLEIQRQLGRESFARGIKVRKEALLGAQRALGQARPPNPDGDPPLPPRPTAEQVGSTMNLERNRRFVRRVEVRPAGRPNRGKRIPVEERAAVYFVGAAEPYAPEYEVDVDFNTGRIKRRHA